MVQTANFREGNDIAGRRRLWDEATGSPYQAKDAFGRRDGIENSSIECGANGAR
jgi:hypothetical protein